MNLILGIINTYIYLYIEEFCYLLFQFLISGLFFFFFCYIGSIIGQLIIWSNMVSIIFLTGLMKELGIHWAALLVER